MNREEYKSQNKCQNEKEADDRELCDFFRERVKFVKEKCIFPYDIKDIKLNNKECYSFELKKDNRIVKNEIIVFRITSTKNVSLIKLKKIYFKKDDIIQIINPIEFFQDSRELYFYINTKNLKNFTNDIFLNFEFSVSGKKFKNTLKIFVKTELEFLPRYRENIGHTIEKEDCVLPDSFDDYNLNYLEESEPITKNLINGYSMNNKVREFSLGEFKEFKFKDEPDTWKLRGDINRPRISTG